MSVAAEFGYRGEELLTLAVGMARATQGKFGGDASTVLDAARVYSEAACYAFAALAGMEEVSEEHRQACSVVSSGFRTAMGHIASYFSLGGEVPTLIGLGLKDPKKPDRLGAFFGEQNSLVFISGAASDALVALRRDPLVLMSLGVAGIRALMETVTSGVRVTQV
jgi:hypothetical protein